MSNSQATSSVLMVRPTTFGFNKQTAESNTFQNQLDVDQKTLHKRVNQEFNAMVEELQSNGIFVTIFEDPGVERKPDAVFPNNWLSTWPDGRIFLYPMATESRRVERSYLALHTLSKDFLIRQVNDISVVEAYGLALESTGVMIFDHLNKIVYGCISPRCDKALFISHANELGYIPIPFHAYDSAGTAIYHTNVMMGIQHTTAVICTESITDKAERNLVLHSLQNTGHEVIEITQTQMNSFCGNILELNNNEGKHFLAMSQTAFEHFTRDQKAILSKDKTLLPFAIPTLETVGGGSVRCMLGEIFLPCLK